MRIVVTGSRGMVGSHVVSRLEKQGDQQVFGLTRQICDLEDPIAVRDYFREVQPDAVVHCAARVGGIEANEFYQFDSLLKNCQMDSNVIKSSVDNGVSTLFYLGSSCMYPPGLSRQLRETDLGDGKLEPTNEGYAIAKLAGAKLCASATDELGLTYKTVIPSNLFGPGDNFLPSRSHLLAAAIRKVHEAKYLGANYVSAWGSGNPRREFVYVEDLADWIVGALPRAEALPNHTNVGAGIDRTVAEIYRIVMQVLEFDGEIIFDETKPDGASSKLMDSSLASDFFAWNPPTSLEQGIAKTYDWFLKNVNANV